MGDPKALLFPGQGAQFVGMAADLVESSPRAREVFARGAEILGWNVLETCLDGPDDKLASTRVSQPAIFLHSMAVLEAIAERAGTESRFGHAMDAAAAAGLSLGEYSALVFAGSLEFDDATRIVGTRGELMQEACDAAPGGMTSFIGLRVEQVEEVVQRAGSAGRIGIANYNSPKQTVISGEASALEAAAAIAKELGCRRVVSLNVAGAYHSPLMASATEKLRPLLEEVRIAAPRVPFYSNVTGDRVSDPESIRQGLVAQVESPVRWSSIVEKIVASGAGSAWEVGPGSALKGLVRNVDRDFSVVSIGDAAGVEKTGQPSVESDG